MTLTLDLSWWQLALVVVDYAIKFVMIGIVPGNRKRPRRMRGCC